MEGITALLSWLLGQSGTAIRPILAYAICTANWSNLPTEFHSCRLIPSGCSYLCSYCFDDWCVLTRLKVLFLRQLGNLISDINIHIRIGPNVGIGLVIRFDQHLKPLFAEALPHPWKCFS